MDFHNFMNLNSPLQNNEREFLFDLNKTPPREFHEEPENEDDSLYFINSGVSHGHHEGRARKKETTNEERLQIYFALLERSINGRLKKTTTTEVSNLFSVPLQTVQRIWRRGQDTCHGENVDVSHKRKGKCGVKKIDVNLGRIAGLDLSQRATLRSLAAALNVSCTTLFRRLKEGLIRRHSNAIKPSLKEGNKRARLQFCLSMLDANTMPENPRFVDMYNTIHIDEKWFYMTKQKETYYLLPEEEDPLRSCQSKNFIGKVMFLAAMARPRFDREGNETFSGKIGVFPFVIMEPAKRRSKNRVAGTLELKPMTSVKRADIKHFLIEKVIPRIRERWSEEDFGRTIFIQQDNAKTHVDPRDDDFRVAASLHGFDIRLMCQPPNSPDLNILDLGYFRAIQTLQHKVCPKSIQELVLAVENAFDTYSSRKVNRIFLTLQGCMREIMKSRGSNDYKIPHMNKDLMERQGNLPSRLACDPFLVRDVIDYLAT